MYLCVCKAVNEARLNEAIQKGSPNWEDLQKSLSVGTGCGQCQKEICDRLAAPVQNRMLAG